MQSVLLGIDVGTTNIRLGAFYRDSGSLFHFGSKSLTILQNTCSTNDYEQSTVEIISKCDELLAECCAACKDNNLVMSGLCFSATCSLVIGYFSNGIFTSFNLSSRDHTSSNQQFTPDIIMWMDHRALQETSEINSTKSKALNIVGQACSIEMEMPKIAWVKNHFKTLVGNNKAFSEQQFFDLADFMTAYYSQQVNHRSMACLNTKWLYAPPHHKAYHQLMCDIDGCSGDNGHFSSDICSKLHLSQSVESGQLGTQFQPCGATNGTFVLNGNKVMLSPGLVDAYAGVIGCLLSLQPPKTSPHLDHPLVMIAGTSTCHFLFSKEPIVIPGWWGPYDVYQNAGQLFSGGKEHVFVYEAGQSAAGKLIDAMKSRFPFQNDTKSNKYDNEELSEDEIIELTSKLHVYPDFHGNRSPLADPSLTGSIHGLTLKHLTCDDDSAICAIHLATCQGLALQTKDIIDHFKRQTGLSCDHVLMCGGLTQSENYIRCHADVLGVPVIIPHHDDSTGERDIGAVLGLKGAAAFAAHANGVEGVWSSWKVKGEENVRCIWPRSSLAKFYEEKYIEYDQLKRQQQST